MNFQKISSPIGDLYLVADGPELWAIFFQTQWSKARKKEWKNSPSPILERAEMQLQEYFAGERRTFDLPLKFEGTEFQKRTWRALNQIPYGQTRSYKQQAVLIKNPAAVRAVGLANGRNRLPIVLPCHRVIGSSGQLTGYAGGLKAKKFLLSLENQMI